MRRQFSMQYAVNLMLGYTVSTANCLMENIAYCEANMKYGSKLLNAFTRLDSVVGVLNVEFYK